MTTLIVCFSVGVILLLTALLILFYRDSGKRMDRMMTFMETQTIQGNRTIQLASSDMADLVIKATADSNQTMTNLFLGREEQINRQLENDQLEKDKQPIPGIETLEGLPPNVAEALLREYEEQNPREWQVVSPQHNNGSEPTPVSHSQMTNNEPPS